MIIRHSFNETTTLAHYINGDYECTLYADGTMVRTTSVVGARPAYPCSIDIKITDYCDMGCKYCHESSTRNGKHADLTRLLDVLSDIPAGVELANGGGNPLSHPDIVDYLVELKARGLIANITVNQGHLHRYATLIEDIVSRELVRGLGISITSSNYSSLIPVLSLSYNIVYHIIAGIHPVSIIDELNSLSAATSKVLVLGYKNFGFGIDYHSPEVDAGIAQWRRFLPSLIGKCNLSFDNLAIEQLELRRLFTDEGWARFYMGDDFQFTMYIDAVKQQYAPTSRSYNRTSFNSTSLIDYFQAGFPCTSS